MDSIGIASQRTLGDVSKCPHPKLEDMSSVANKSDVLIPAPLGIPQIFVIEKLIVLRLSTAFSNNQKISTKIHLYTYITVPLQPDAQYQWSSPQKKRVGE